MEEPPPDGPGEPTAEEDADLLQERHEKELRRRDVHERLREVEGRWDSEGDSEGLWEREHDLLIRLQRAGDLHALMKRARRAKRALGPKARARDMAQAALSLWVLERYDEADPVLRTAIERLPRNRYPWSLVLRHLTWDREPREAMEFIRASLDTVPWRGFALVQLATLNVDAASRALSRQELEGTEGHLREARDHLEAIPSQTDTHHELERTAQRLMVLVETLERRLEDARSAREARLAEGEERVFLKESEETLERGIREAAEASGVVLEGRTDDDMDLDELEKAAKGELSEEERDDRVTVLEVTGTRDRGRLRRRRKES